MNAAEFATMVEAQVGDAYVLGAEASPTNPNPTRFDCSELVEWAYERAGVPFPDGAWLQYDATKPVTGEPAVGDLVFLKNNAARPNGIGHVAVLTRKLANDWLIIEAKGRAYGVVRSTLSEWKRKSTYAGLRRYAPFTEKMGGGDVADHIYLVVTDQGEAASRLALVTTAKQQGDHYEEGTVTFAVHTSRGPEADAYINIARARVLDCQSVYTTGPAHTTMVVRNRGVKPECDPEVEGKLTRVGDKAREILSIIG